MVKTPRSAIAPISRKTQNFKEIHLSVYSFRYPADRQTDRQDMQNIHDTPLVEVMRGMIGKKLFVFFHISLIHLLILTSTASKMQTNLGDLLLLNSQIQE